MKAFAVIFLLVAFSSAFADDFYKSGADAMAAQDYVRALKYLFAYRTAKLSELEKTPDFLKRLDANIALAEKKLTQYQTIAQAEQVGTVNIDTGARRSGTSASTRRGEDKVTTEVERSTKGTGMETPNAP